MNDEQFNRVHGITPPSEIQLVRPADQVWKLDDASPDVAVLACSEDDARAKIDRMGLSGKLVRIK